MAAIVPLTDPPAHGLAVHGRLLLTCYTTTLCQCQAAQGLGTLMLWPCLL